MNVKSIAALFIVLLTLVGFGLLLSYGIGENKIFYVGNINQGLDLMGGVSILYEADKEAPSRDEMNSAAALIQGRLDRRGYTEAEVAIEGDKRIRVDIPGVEDAEEAITEIGATAMLYFAEVVSEEEEYDFLGIDIEANDIGYFRVVLTGEYVTNAYRTVNQESQNSLAQQVVALEFNSEGSYFFEEATRRNIGKPIYIYLDDSVLSAPTVQSVISGGNCIITGNFTVAGAEELSALIRAGSLPFALDIIYVNNIGAKLGQDALDTSIMAGIIGLGLVVLFMLVMYRVLGASAALALLFYTEAVLLALSLWNVTLTLPGIAGIILSVGMAVDANVIIFERIREELTAGKTLRASVDSGFKRALPAILDGNATTLIAALVLFFMGMGPVRGFAQTLTIGICLSMFTALIVTKFILNAFIGIGLKNPKLYSKGGAVI